MSSRKRKGKSEIEATPQSSTCSKRAKRDEKTKDNAEDDKHVSPKFSKADEKQKDENHEDAMIVARLMESVMKLNLEPVRKSLKRHPFELDSNTVERRIKEYRRYLVIRLYHKHKKFQWIAPPPVLVDEVWHQHILHTRLYHEHCQQLFGEYLHHDPTSEEDHKDVQKAQEQGYQEVLKLYGTIFGEPATNTDDLWFQEFTRDDFNFDTAAGCG